jgi:hypothetical protein
MMNHNIRNFTPHLKVGLEKFNYPEMFRCIRVLQLPTTS